MPYTPFHYLVDAGEPDECWNWMGYLSSRWGHGQVKMGGKACAAHREAYIAAKGEIPEGHVIRHTCNNAQCCNPKHLISGTTAQNVADRVAAGRSAKGTANGRSKLSENDVRRIRRLMKRGWQRKYVAFLHGVDPKLVSDIVAGKLWRDV